jgi:hypothetical protein
MEFTWSYKSDHQLQGYHHFQRSNPFMRSLLVADGSMIFLNNVMNPQPKEHERELEGKGAGTFKAPP